MSDEQLSEVEHFAVELPDKDAPESFKKRERRRAIAKAQAEISFKAGIKTVVDYLRKRIILSGQTDAPFTPPKKIRYVDFLPIPYNEWQAKLKEWEGK